MAQISKYWKDNLTMSLCVKNGFDVKTAGLASSVYYSLKEGRGGGGEGAGYHNFLHFLSIKEQ